MVPKMTTSEAFKEAFIHDDHFVLGRKLLPFCLRHYIILESLKSPLILGGSVSIQDIQMAVQICSTSSFDQWKECHKKKGFYWKSWLKFTRLLPLKENIDSFQKYVSDFVPSFPFWDNTSSDSLKCPPFFVVASRLLGSFTRQEIMSLPLGEVVAWGLAKMESEGRSPESLMTEVEIDALTQIAKMESPK